jgi:hypothetical protein
VLTQALKRCVVAALALIGGCASEAASGPCEPRIGTYLAHFERQSGDCAAPADQVSTFDGKAAAPGPCTVKSTTSEDKCGVTIDVECPEDGGNTSKLVGKVTWTRDASSGSGVIQTTLRRADKSIVCDGTFLQTSTRQ